MVALLVALGFVAGVVPATTDSTELRREALIAALRNGGYTIMLRHTKTDHSVNEGTNYATLKRAQQRNLNDEGVRDAKLIGTVMIRFGIPVGEILSSQMYRTRETAEYAFGDPTPHPELQQLAATPEQKALVVAQPKPGTNRVIVTHHFIIERYAPGIVPGDIMEGEAAVVKPAADGSLTLVGRFKMADWEALGAATAAAGASTSAPNTPAGFSHSPPAGGAGALPPAMVLLHSRAGKLAFDYLQAFNIGDSAAMRTFIDKTMVANPNRPTAQRLESFAKLFTEHGPLTLVSIEAVADDSVKFTVRSKAGQPSITVKASAEQWDRVASVTFAWGRAHH